MHASCMIGMIPCHFCNTWQKWSDLFVTVLLGHTRTERYDQGIFILLAFLLINIIIISCQQTIHMLLTSLRIALFNLTPKEAFVFYVNTRIQFVSKSLNVSFCVCVNTMNVRHSVLTHWKLNNLRQHTDLYKVSTPVSYTHLTLPTMAVV